MIPAKRERRGSPIPFSITRRDVLLGLAIVFVAFGYRLIIIVDRAHAPAAVSAFDPLPVGTDQATYYSHIGAYRAGDFPPARYYFQPGMSWYMVASNALLRTDNLGALRVFQAALASANCGLFVMVGWLAFGRRSVGFLAGLGLALYPVSAFYDTDFVIVAQATALLTLGLIGALWLGRSPRAWGAAALFGLSFGALALTRFDALLLGPIFGLWLLAVRRDRRAFLQVGLAALLCVAVILPVALHNRAGGAPYLITPVGQQELYRGNNRDTGGDWGGGQASATTSDRYLQTLWKDIRLAPRRFAELELRKIGLFLSAGEPGNNLSYVGAGRNLSRALRWNPLSFPVLLALFGFGLAQLAQQRRWDLVALFASSLLATLAATLTIWVEARIRTPGVVILWPVVAYGLVRAAEQLAGWRRAWRERRAAPAWREVRLIFAPLPVLALVLIAAPLAADRLPRPLTVEALPASVQRADAVYDGTLRLLGWEIQEEYSRAGIIRPFDPYVVSLYWTLLQPTAADYSFALALVIDGERVTGFDHPIGRVSYPDHPTSQWEPGTLYVEHVGLSYKGFEGPIERSGDLLLAVYPERRADAVLPAEGIRGSPAHLRLAQPAIIWGPGRLPDLATPTDIPFGDVLRLRGWTAPAEGRAGDAVEITLGWQTTRTPITRLLIFSVQLLDASGQSAAQKDSPPHDGQLLSTSLPTDYRFADTKTLTLPEAPGSYQLVALIYDYETGQRLAVPGQPDAMLPLGELVVTGGGE